mgnify:CR=1 FL=1
MVPYVGPDYAIASQSWVNPLWGTDGVELLANGQSALDVLDGMVQKDEGQATRQAHMIDRKGNVAAFTGEECTDWAGHELGDGFSVAGNMLAGKDVVGDTARAYQDNLDKPFAERLLLAMEAGERAFGARHLPLIRQAMAEQKLDGFLVPHEDEHQNEYLPEANDRLAWATGFTGSAGAAVILKDKAAVFVDGRYTLQVRDQVDTTLFEPRHLIDEPATDNPLVGGHTPNPERGNQHGLGKCRHRVHEIC